MKSNQSESNLIRDDSSEFFQIFPHQRPALKHKRATNEHGVTGYLAHLKRIDALEKVRIT